MNGFRCQKSRKRGYQPLHAINCSSLQLLNIDSFMYRIVFAASCNLTRFILFLAYGSDFMYSCPETLYPWFSLKENFRLENDFLKVSCCLGIKFSEEKYAQN